MSVASCWIICFSAGSLSHLVVTSSAQLETRPSHRSAGRRVCHQCATLINPCATLFCVVYLMVNSPYIIVENYLFREAQLIKSVAHFPVLHIKQCGTLFLAAVCYFVLEQCATLRISYVYDQRSVVFIIRRWSRLRRDKSAGLPDSGLASASIPLNKVILFHHCSHPTPSNISYELYYCRTRGVIAP